MASTDELDSKVLACMETMVKLGIEGGRRALNTTQPSESAETAVLPVPAVDAIVASETLLRQALTGSVPVEDFGEILSAVGRIFQGLADFSQSQADGAAEARAARILETQTAEALTEVERLADRSQPAGHSDEDGASNDTSAVVSTVDDATRPSMPAAFKPETSIQQPQDGLGQGAEERLAQMTQIPEGIVESPPTTTEQMLAVTRNVAHASQSEMQEDLWSKTQIVGLERNTKPAAALKAIGRHFGIQSLDLESRDFDPNFWGKVRVEVQKRLAAGQDPDQSSVGFQAFALKSKFRPEMSPAQIWVHMQGSRATDHKSA